MTRHNGKYISYLRVSTAKQEQSGLGLEAQRAAVEAWLNGGSWQLVQEVVEVESGKSHRNRPGLAQALEACRRYGAKLIISRLDRLSRDPVFLLNLGDAGIDFTAVDMPNVNRMTVGVIALVAEQEREAISQRTKAALAAAKARGQRLGRPAGHIVPHRDEGARRGGASMAVKADGFAADLAPVLAALAGLSANAAAVELVHRGYPTPRGGKRRGAGAPINTSATASPKFEA